eukprot:517605_1
MALTEAIRFRWLESQLSTNECHQFVNKLLHQNRDIIAQALFKQILKDTNEHNGIEINNIISKVIQSRQNKPKPIATQNIKLDQLPKRLIGVIASFCNQNDYFDFSFKIPPLYSITPIYAITPCIHIFPTPLIYLGCNSPNLLQELDLNEINNYSTV